MRKGVPSNTEKMKKLRGHFKVGKWIDLKDEKHEAGFNGRRLRQDSKGTLHIEIHRRKAGG